jgi:hypothetical protein
VSLLAMLQNLGPDVLLAGAISPLAFVALLEALRGRGLRRPHF